MSDSQNTKETVAQMTEKLKEIETHNEEMLKEIKILKWKQQNWGKALIQLN